MPRAIGMRTEMKPENVISIEARVTPGAGVAHL